MNTFEIISRVVNLGSPNAILSVSTLNMSENQMEDVGENLSIPSVDQKLEFTNSNAEAMDEKTATAEETSPVYVDVEDAVSEAETNVPTNTSATVPKTDPIPDEESDMPAISSGTTASPAGEADTPAVLSGTSTVAGPETDADASDISSGKSLSTVPDEQVDKPAVSSGTDGVPSATGSEPSSKSAANYTEAISPRTSRNPHAYYLENYDVNLELRHVEYGAHTLAIPEGQVVVLARSYAH